MAGTENAVDLSNWGVAAGGFLAAALVGIINYFRKPKEPAAETQPVIASATIFSDRATMESWAAAIRENTRAVERVTDLLEDDARHREIDRAVRDALAHGKRDNQ